MFWRHGELPSRFLVTISYSLYVYMLFILLISSMSCFIVHYAYAMFIRLVIYMLSYLRHPWTYLCVLTLFLTNMYALDLMHIHNDHMDVYDSCFDVLISMLNAMIIRSLICMYSF